MDQQPHISVVISTYSRADRLRDALTCLLAQVGEVHYEVIVVDNNSTDHTREAIESFAAHSAGRLRYVFEGKQGVSFGRNAGATVARGSVLAFTDDDMRMAEDWVANLKRVFDSHPELAYAGGKVLPQWLAPPPAWLTSRHWSPIALLDYGTVSVPVDATRRRALITANFAVRRADFERVGGFSPIAQRDTNDVCSTEDHELLLRLWRVGAHGMYFPELVGWAEVQPKRMTKAYHRHWHKGHGRCSALMHDEQLEPSTAGRLFDVPAHPFRQAAVNAWDWFAAWRQGDEAAAFWHETRLWFCAGFVQQRYREYRALGRHSVVRELANFAGTASKALRRTAGGKSLGG